MATQCQGWRRYSGAFTFGPAHWEQCKNDAVVNIVIIQEGKKETFPGCMVCWNECISKGMKIVEVVPLQSEKVKENKNEQD